MKILPLHPYSKEEAVNQQVQKLKYYLVKNFDKKCENHYQKLKEHAITELETNYSKYDSYQIVFYKSSKRTNLNYKENESDLIEWHGDDIIYTITWSKGKLISEFFYWNGAIINVPDIEDSSIINN